MSESSWSSAARELSKELRGLHRSGVDAVTSKRGWLVFTLCSLGLLLDGTSTLYLLQYAEFGEGNPFARAAMDKIGTELYVCAVTVVCLIVLPALAASRPSQRHLYWVKYGAILVCAGKLAVGVWNLSLLLP